MWIRQVEDGKYQYGESYLDPYTEKRKQVTVTLNSKSNAAQSKARNILNGKIESKLSIKTNTKLTLLELLNEWWSQYEKTVRNSSAVSNQRALDFIKRNMDTSALVSKVDVKFFQRFIDGLDFSSEYTKKIKGILNMSFKYAEKMEYIDESPLRKVTIPRKPVTLKEFESVKNKFLEREEAELLISEFKNTFQSARMGQLAEFMYLTGTRIGEAIAITRKDYLKEERKVNIHGTLDYSSGYKNATKEMTKNLHSYREVLLTERTIRLLDQVILENELKFNYYDNDDYLFVGKTGKPLQINSFNTSIKTINSNLGKKRIKNKPLSSHIFRHTHISLLAELGIPLRAVMDRVGHNDGETTTKIYTHVTKKSKVSVLEKLNNTDL